LQDVLPTLTPDAPLPNLKAAYVGIVPETGSLFAMSPTRFPLVAFGGADKFGSGSNWGRGRGRFIEAEEHTDSSGGSGHIDIDRNGDVDAITKARKHREKIQMQTGGRCTPESLYSDRRCLVGVRPLDDGDGHESRMRRLLDGPAGRLPLTSPVASAFEGGSVPVASGEGEVNWSRSGRSTISGADGVGVGWREGVGILSWWEGMTATALLGVVSFWFAFRKLKGVSGGKKLMLPLGEMKEAGGEDQIREVNGNGDVSSPRSNSEVDANTPVQTSIPKPPQPNGTPLSTPLLPIQADDGEGDSDPDVEAEATPGKRKARRGKRGKKKKEKGGNGNPAGLLSPGEEMGGEGVRSASVNGNDSGEGAPISSLVVNSPRPHVPAAPSLIVSDTILGKNTPSSLLPPTDYNYFLGFGSHGTVVFQGSLQGRAVAVKRLLQDFVTLAEREVSILQESDDHPNVIRYYYQESQHNFLYIALELCPCSLADIVETPDREQWRQIAVGFEPKRALLQIASGLRHLHALKLVHRDIKPQNILVSGGNGDGRESGGGGGRGGYRMLISDFGLCKKLDVDQTSFLPTAQGAMAAGTVGWRAPEILRGEVKLDEISVQDEHSMSSRGSSSTIHGNGTPTQVRPTRLTKSVDIFALGCLFYYTLTNGGHPFGDRFEREVNILKNAKNLEGLERFGEEGAEAVDLIEQMLDPEAGERWVFRLLPWSGGCYMN
jgi:serine/threonine-protein kinase/endoribonuclease IRE1